MLPLALAGALLLTACAAPRQADFSRPDDPPSLFTTVTSNAPPSPLPASAIFTPKAAEAVFDAADESNKRIEITMKRTPTTRFGAAWADAEDDVRTEFYRIDDDGNVLLTAAIDHEEQAISLFNPPLTAHYANLKPGGSLVQEVSLRVMDLRNPRRQRESGTAKQTIEHLGRRTILTQHGTFAADCISVKFDANLRMARAVRESTLYVVEGLGVIAAEHKETITALGLFSRTSRQSLLRRDVAAAIAPQGE